MKKIVLSIVVLVALTASAQAADLSTTNDENHRYGWQDRQRVCPVGMEQEKCQALVLQLGTGGDGGATGGAGAADGGSAGGATGGTGCGPR